MNSKLSPNLLSIVIPARNAETTIGKCLTSIFTAISNTGLAIPVILILDRCSDRTNEIARQFDVKIGVCKGKGRSQARNTGADLANTLYVCFIDADSWVSPDFFANLIEILKTNKYDLVQATINPVTSNPDDWFFKYFCGSYYRVSKGTFNLLEGWHLPRLPMCDSAGLCVRNSSFKAIGCFDSKLPRFEDQDLAKRLFLSGFHLYAALDLIVFKYVEPKSIQDFLIYKIEGTIGLLRSKGYILRRSQLPTFKTFAADILVYRKGVKSYLKREFKESNYKMTLFTSLLPVLITSEKIIIWITYLPCYEKALNRKLSKINFFRDPYQSVSFGSITNSHGEYRFSPFGFDSLEK
jgi:glycosyltransferase involved in cell wall biosynthesis